MNDAEIIESLKSALAEKAGDITNPSTRRIFLKIDSHSLIPVITILRDKFDMTYLATISGVDKGDFFEIVYHFADTRTCLNVRTAVPRADPRIESITNVIPGAILYERELQDMFGIIVDHIPDARPLLLPDGWPPANHPLRKDWKFERPVETIPGGKS